MQRQNNDAHLIPLRESRRSRMDRRALQSAPSALDNRSLGEFEAMALYLTGLPGDREKITKRFFLQIR